MLDRLHALLAGAAAAFAFLWVNALVDPPVQTRANSRVVTTEGPVRIERMVRRPCPACPPCRTMPAPRHGANAQERLEARIEALEGERDDLLRQLARGEEVVCERETRGPTVITEVSSAESRPVCRSKFVSAIVGPFSGSYGLSGDMLLGQRVLLGAEIGRTQAGPWAGARVGLAFGD